MPFLAISDHLFTDSLWQSSAPFDKRAAAIDLARRARYADAPGHTPSGILLHRGELIAPVRELADAWHWTATTVRRFLDMLIRAGYLRERYDAKHPRLRILACTDQLIGGGRHAIAQPNIGSSAESGAPNGPANGAQSPAGTPHDFSQLRESLHPDRPTERPTDCNSDHENGPPNGAPNGPANGAPQHAANPSEINDSHAATCEERPTERPTKRPTERRTLEEGEIKQDSLSLSAQAIKLADKYPKIYAQRQTLTAALRALENGEDFDHISQALDAYRAAYYTWPPAERSRSMNGARWFDEGHWDDDPAMWASRHPSADPDQPARPKFIPASTDQSLSPSEIAAQMNP